MWRVLTWQRIIRRDWTKSANSKCSPSQKKHRVILATSLVMPLGKQPQINVMCAQNCTDIPRKTS